MDKCEGQNKLPELIGVPIVLRPENTTAVYQSLDQGLISMTKIQYCSLMLRETIDILLRMQDSRNNFKSTTGNGIWGIKEEQIPNVRDAINLMIFHESSDSSVLIEEQRLTLKKQDSYLCGHSLLKLSPIPDSPLVNLLNDVNAYDSPSSMHTIVNTPALDEGILQDSLAASEIQDLFDTQDGKEEHSSINEVEDQRVTAAQALQMLTNVAAT
eukprot:IDg23850t1